jgi:hypothetical protein
VQSAVRPLRVTNGGGDSALGSATLRVATRDHVDGGPQIVEGR